MLTSADGTYSTVMYHTVLHSNMMNSNSLQWKQHSNAHLTASIPSLSARTYLQVQPSKKPTPHSETVRNTHGARCGHTTYLFCNLSETHTMSSKHPLTPLFPPSSSTPSSLSLLSSFLPSPPYLPSLSPYLSRLITVSSKCVSVLTTRGTRRRLPRPYRSMNRSL